MTGDLFDLPHPCLSTLVRVLNTPKSDRVVWAMQRKGARWCRHGGGGEVALSGYGVTGRGMDHAQAARSRVRGAAVRAGV